MSSLGLVIHIRRVSFSRFYFLQLSKCSCASTVVTTAYCFLFVTNTCHLLNSEQAFENRG